MAKKDVSTIISGMGVALALVEGLVKRVRRAGGSDEDIHRMVTDEGSTTMDQIAALIVGQREVAVVAILPPVCPTYSLTIDHDQTLAQMVAAAGYDAVNSDITAGHFSVKGEGKCEVEVTLFHFDQVMTSKEVIAELDRVGYRPGKIEELLVLGVEQPEVQRQFPVIALGSGWRHPCGRRCVPFLSVWRGRRLLGLVWFGRGWPALCRFLAVRK